MIQIMTASNYENLADLYRYYNNTIKPMVVNVESKYESHPLPLYNEIRAFNDHVSRCFREDVDDEYCEAQLEKAKVHLDRLLLDLFKYIDVFYFEKVEKFEKQCKNIDLTTINNGEFYIKYRKLRKEATEYIREAKQQETINKANSYNLYQEANNTLEELDELIESSMTYVNWARVRFSVKKFSKLILWFIAAIGSGIISKAIDLIPYDFLLEIITNSLN